MRKQGDQFRNYLQDELVRRCKANSRYSLRAFSRALGVESSFMSKILRGEREVTARLIDRVGSKLALGPEEISGFKSSEPSKVLRAGGEGAGDPVDYQQLAYDSFEVISDWHHYAILELLTVRGFQPRSRWIAAALGISPAEVDAAIARMQRLGMIATTLQGKITQKPRNHTTVGTPHTAAAFKRMQKQILQMALQALDDTPIEERDQSAMTMAIDSALLPEAKKRIQAFRRGLCSFLQDGRKRDRIYHLSLSLYPVSKPLKRRPKSGKSL